MSRGEDDAAAVAMRAQQGAESGDGGGVEAECRLVQQP